MPFCTWHLKMLVLGSSCCYDRFSTLFQCVGYNRYIVHVGSTPLVKWMNLTEKAKQMPKLHKLGFTCKSYAKVNMLTKSHLSRHGLRWEFTNWLFDHVNVCFLKFDKAQNIFNDIYAHRLENHNKTCCPLRFWSVFGATWSNSSSVTPVTIKSIAFDIRSIEFQIT